MLVDVGLPVEHRGARYNCRAFLLDGRILLLRPKMWLANDGNYRELRWFSAWKRYDETERYMLPECVRAVSGQAHAPIGDATLQLADTSMGTELCEELFTPQSPHIRMALRGVEVMANGSGSHHQLRKLDQRLDLVRSATAKTGGVYLYSNLRGCDGTRMYFDGCSCVVVNGEVVAQGQQFALEDVETVVATCDLDAVTSFRAATSSFREQASAQPTTSAGAVIDATHFSLCARGPGMAAGRVLRFPTEPRAPHFHRFEDEIARGPACWLWDYLRRSGASGFLLPLSGGADSAAVAAIVAGMCQLVVEAISDGDKVVLDDARRIGGYALDERPTSAKELAGRLLTTIYMGSSNSSAETRALAASLAGDIGASHHALEIDTVTAALVTVFEAVSGRRPRFRSRGGTTAENLALQNIQARARMVLAFMCAQLMPWVSGRSGFLLVLGSANVDEGLRGYLTKYDCSSADLNPIGGVSKNDLKAFLRWSSSADSLTGGTLPSLARIVTAPPTAELEPREDGYVQTDEQDMGMSYEELGIFGRLRKIGRCGPLSMFHALLPKWGDRLNPAQIAEKVKFFFRMYSINRHKMTTITPAYHAESYSPDDNRFDLRQFLYNTRWPWQFAAVDEAAQAATDVGADGSRSQ